MSSKIINAAKDIKKTNIELIKFDFFLFLLFCNLTFSSTLILDTYFFSLLLIFLSIVNDLSALIGFLASTTSISVFSVV